MKKPRLDGHMQEVLEQARLRQQVIRARIEWTEERRRDLWRRMDALRGVPADAAALVEHDEPAHSLN
jgi:hypothetical protein